MTFFLVLAKISEIFSSGTPRSLVTKFQKFSFTLNAPKFYLTPKCTVFIDFIIYSLKFMQNVVFTLPNIHFKLSIVTVLL